MKPSERTFARRIDPTSLQLFVAVCKLGSIGRPTEREVVACDCSTLPVTGRLLVNHLAVPAERAETATSE